MFIPQILSPVMENIQQHGTRQAFCINCKFYSYAVFGQHIAAIRNAIQQYQPAGNRIGLVTNDDIAT